MCFEITIWQLLFHNWNIFITKLSKEYQLYLEYKLVITGILTQTCLCDPARQRFPVNNKYDLLQVNNKHDSFWNDQNKKSE